SSRRGNPGFERGARGAARLAGRSRTSRRGPVSSHLPAGAVKLAHRRVLRKGPCFTTRRPFANAGIDIRAGGKNPFSISKKPLEHEVDLKYRGSANEHRKTWIHRRRRPHPGARRHL